MVVVAILGILTALTVPTLWTYLRAATLRAGAEETVAILNGARELAVRLNTTVCVSHDGAQARYHIGGCTGTVWTGSTTDPSGHIGLANQLRVSGSSHLCFNHLGAGTPTPSPCAANGTLIVSSPGGGSTLTVVMATTGRLRIQ
jgi:Tfp pilus assembly protein FimT